MHLGGLIISSLHSVKLRHDIYIKSKSYKFEFLEESWSFNMVSKPGLAEGLRFEPPLCNIFPIY